MSCCFALACTRCEGTNEGGDFGMSGYCIKVCEEAKLSPDSNRIRSFICIPCMLIILSWTVEVVECIDGACVFFSGVKDPPTSSSFCVAAKLLKSGFEGS